MHTLPNLPDSITREVFATLCGSLPPALTETPEARASRDDVAIASVAALHPTNAFEAKLAADIVLAEAHYAASLRQAGEHRGDLAATSRCRTLAMGMLRQMRGLLRDYQRMQAERDKALAAMHPAAMERAGYWFRDASVPSPEPAPAPVEPAEVAVDPPQVDFAALTEAEQYALLYPDRARGIRAERGLPARLDYGPPEPDIVHDLVNGTSPILRALDQPLATPRDMSPGTAAISVTETMRRNRG
jgi:hypothetical protein